MRLVTPARAGVVALLFATAFAFAQDVSSPLHFDDNGIPIAAVLVNGERIDMGVDTGAGMTVLSESSAQRVHVRDLHAADRPVLDALGRPLAAQMGIADLEIAGALLRDLPVLVLPDERLRARTVARTMFEFDGLLGWNAMDSHRVTIDYAARTLRFEPPSHTCGAMNLWAVDSRPLVAFEADGAVGRALLDTGARTSVLFAPNAGEHMRLVAGASGIATRRESTRDGVTLVVGGERFERLSIPVSAPPAHNAPSALIGSDLLAGRRVVVDATCGRFTVGPRG